MSNELADYENKINNLILEIIKTQDEISYTDWMYCYTSIYRYVTKSIYNHINVSKVHNFIKNQYILIKKTEIIPDKFKIRLINGLYMYYNRCEYYNDLRLCQLLHDYKVRSHYLQLIMEKHYLPIDMQHEVMYYF